MSENKPGKTVCEIAIEAMGSPINPVKCKAVGDVGGWWYFWEDARGGAQAIVTDDHEVLTAGSAISYEQLLAKFQEGNRTEL